MLESCFPEEHRCPRRFRVQDAVPVQDLGEVPTDVDTDDDWDLSESDLQVEEAPEGGSDDESSTTL